MSLKPYLNKNYCFVTASFKENGTILGLFWSIDFAGGKGRIRKEIFWQCSAKMANVTWDVWIGLCKMRVGGGEHREKETVQLFLWIKSPILVSGLFKKKLYINLKNELNWIYRSKKEENRRKKSEVRSRGKLKSGFSTQGWILSSEATVSENYFLLI